MRTPGRRFLGQRPAAPLRDSGLDAVADVLISGPVASAPPEPPPAPAAAAEPRAALRGPYVVVPAGIEPADRRRVGLAVARQLAPSCRPAAVFVFEGGRADAHVLGEPACGRMGPQNYLHASDTSRAVADLVGQCDQVAVVLLDRANGLLPSLGRTVRRAVFVAAPDPESVVETYREVKQWRTRGADTPLGLFVVDSEDGAEAAGVHRRLAAAARQCLGCQVDHDGFMDGAARAAHAEPMSILAQAPVEEVWPRLVRALSGQAVTARDEGTEGQRDEGIHRPARQEAQPPAPAEFPAFAWWTPEGQGELLAAVEAQVPALMGERLRLVFRVDVAEPDAPPLAAVRDDGALVAIVLKDTAGPTDTQAAQRWLDVHRTLVARAYPAAGISGRATAAIVLAPLVPPQVGDGVRRFITVRSGGRHGIVLLP